MLPTLIYPMLIPALMGAIRLSTLILAGDPIGADDQIWFRLLVAFDTVLEFASGGYHVKGEGAGE